jgi:hypothetical protein
MRTFRISFPNGACQSYVNSIELQADDAFGDGKISELPVVNMVGSNCAMFKDQKVIEIVFPECDIVFWDGFYKGVCFIRNNWRMFVDE